MDLIRKLILRDHPDYDFERYSFAAGDVVTASDNAKIVVKYSAIDYVCAYVIRRGFKYNTLGEQFVYYDDLPNLRIGEYVKPHIKWATSLNWKLYEFRKLETMDVLLVEEPHWQCFHAFVINTDNEYYKETCIYTENPNKEYIIRKG